MQDTMDELDLHPSSMTERLAAIREEEEDNGRAQEPERQGLAPLSNASTDHAHSPRMDEVAGKASTTHDVLPLDNTLHKANPFNGQAEGSSSSPSLDIGGRISRVASPRRDIFRPGSSPLHRSFTPGDHGELLSTSEIAGHFDLIDRVISDPPQSDSESDPEHQQRGRPRQLSHLALSHPRPMSASTFHRLTLDAPSSLKVPGHDPSLGDDLGGTSSQSPNSPTAPPSYPPRALSSSPRRTNTPGGGGTGSRSNSATGVKMVRQMSGVDSDITGPWFDHFARLTGNQPERLRAFKKSPMERRRNALIKVAHEIPGGWESLGPVIRKQMLMSLDELASKEIGGGGRRSKSTSQSPHPKPPRDRSSSRSRLGDSAISPTGAGAANAQAQKFKIETIQSERSRSKSRDRGDSEDTPRAKERDHDDPNRTDRKTIVRVESKPIQSLKTSSSSESKPVSGDAVKKTPKQAAYAGSALHRKPRFKLNVVSESPASTSASASMTGNNGSSRRAPRSSRGDSLEPFQATGRRLRQRRNMFEEVDLESNDEDEPAMKEVKRMARSAEAFQSRLSESFNRVKEASYLAAIDSLAVSMETIENETNPAFVEEIRKLESKRLQRHAAARHRLLLAERSVSATVKCERKLGRDTFKYAAHELRQMMHDDVIKKRNGLQEVMDSSRSNFGPHCGAWFRNENDQTTFGWDTQKHEWSSFLPESWRDDLDADLTICRSVEAGGTMAAQKAAEIAARRYRAREEADLAVLRHVDSMYQAGDRRRQQGKKQADELTVPSDINNDASSSNNGGRARKLSKKAQEAAEIQSSAGTPAMTPTITTKKSTVSMDKLLGGSSSNVDGLIRKDRDRDKDRAKMTRPYADIHYEGSNQASIINNAGTAHKQMSYMPTGSSQQTALHPGQSDDDPPRKKIKKVAKDPSDQVKRVPAHRTMMPSKGIAVPQLLVGDGDYRHLYPDQNKYPLAPSSMEPYTNQSRVSRAPLMGPGPQDFPARRSPPTLMPVGAAADLSPVYERRYLPLSSYPGQPPPAGLRPGQQGVPPPAQEHYYNHPRPSSTSYMPFPTDDGRGIARPSGPPGPPMSNPGNAPNGPSTRYALSGPPGNAYDGQHQGMMGRLPSQGAGPEMVPNNNNYQPPQPQITPTPNQMSIQQPYRRW